MATSTTLTPPILDEPTESEETKYNMRRPSGVPGILPDPGSRRFSKMYVSRALGIDASLDAYPSKDQSGWDDGFDVYSEECWRRWVP